jgi:cytidylate kinase
MTIIAMTCELGTLGREIADATASRLGLAVTHHEAVVGKLGQRLGLDAAAMQRHLAGQATLIERWRLDDRQLGRFAAQEILQVAAEGKRLIRGWGAVPVLSPIPHVLCVRVCASLEARVRVLRERDGSRTEDAARAEIAASDAAHDRAMQRFFSRDCRDPSAYHLVLNSEQLGLEQCVEQIARLAQCYRFEETETSAAALRQMLAEARVHTQRYHDFAGALGEPFIDAAGNGQVTLTGATDHEHAIAKIEQHWRGRERSRQETKLLPPRIALM